MTERVFRPDVSPQLAIAHALEAGEAKARGALMDPDAELADAPAAIREVVRAGAVKFARSDVRGQVARAGARERDMRRLQSSTERKLPDLRRRLDRAEAMAAAYPIRSDLQDLARRLRSEIKDLEHLAGRAGQAAIEWQVWPGEVERLAAELLDRPAEIEARVRAVIESGGVP